MQPTIRPAHPDDTGALISLLAGDTSSEAAALTGGVDRARQFQQLMAEFSPVPLWSACAVAEVHGEVTGVLQQGMDEFKPNVRFLSALLRLWGLDCLRLLPRGWALQRVRVATPRDAWVLRELHVRPDRRGRGIGACLLEYAEQSAADNGFSKIALTTRTNNPARRLYDRTGYLTVTERTHLLYKRWTGADGRVLMVKLL